LVYAQHGSEPKRRRRLRRWRASHTTHDASDDTDDVSTHADEHEVPQLARTSSIQAFE
tara:strand:- start:196 stop:369 length:174 start_codon:yes stop_codon:yes gene_type:complete